MAKHRPGMSNTPYEDLYPELRQRKDIDTSLLDELLALLEEYRAGADFSTGSLTEHRAVE